MTDDKTEARRIADRDLIKLAASGTDRGDALRWPDVLLAMVRVMAEGL